MGEAGEGQNITHQQKKMAEAALRGFRDRFSINLPDERCSVPVPAAHRRQPGGGLSEGAAPGAGRPRPGPAAHRRGAGGPGAVGLRRPAAGAPGRRSPPPWPSCGSSTPCCGTSRSASGWCRSSRQSRTFGMEDVRQYGIFSQVGQLCRHPGRRPAHVLQGGQERPDAQGHPTRPAPCRPGWPPPHPAAPTTCR